MMKCELCNGFGNILCSCEKKICDVCNGSKIQGKGCKINNRPVCGICSGCSSLCCACGGAGKINYGIYTSYDSCLRCFGLGQIPVWSDFISQSTNCDICKNSGYIRCECTIKKTLLRTMLLTILPTKTKSNYIYVFSVLCMLFYPDSTFLMINLVIQSIIKLMYEKNKLIRTIVTIIMIFNSVDLFKIVTK